MATPELPEFAIAVRGYDRRQVDDYVATLRSYVHELTTRVRSAEDHHQQSAGAHEDEQPTAVLTVDLTDPGPTRGGADPAAALGEHVAGIVRAAEQAGQQMTREAQERAREVLVEAQQGAAYSQAILTKATAEADQLLAAARDDANDLILAAREHAEQRQTELLAKAQQESEDIRAHAHRDALEQENQLRLQIESLERRRADANAALLVLRAALTADPEAEHAPPAASTARPTPPPADGYAHPAPAEGPDPDATQLIRVQR